jgi:cellulase
MKTISLLSSCLLAVKAVSGHGMWQRLKVNGADQGQLVAINPPAVNNPVTVVSGASIACNTGLVSPLSNSVVTIPAGGSVEAWFEHVIGGPQGANDADNPIAASHKGPIIVYLAKVLKPLNICYHLLTRSKGRQCSDRKRLQQLPMVQNRRRRTQLRQMGR